MICDCFFFHLNNYGSRPFFFRYDECSLFIGYCESDRKIKLPDIKEIMKRDLVRNVLRDFGNVGVVNRYPLDRHIPHSPAAGLNKTPSLSVAVLDVRFRHTLKESLHKSGKDDETMPDDAIRKHFAVEKIDMTGKFQLIVMVALIGSISHLCILLDISLAFHTLLGAFLQVNQTSLGWRKLFIG